MSDQRVLDIAIVCHEANRAYCQSLGDDSQLPWYQAPDWQKQSAIQGVEFRFKNPNASRDAMHVNWLFKKLQEGWRYGPVKDPKAKEHPCMLPYSDLPLEQRRKDALFSAIFDAMTSPVKTLDFEKKTLQTKNTLYKLGEDRIILGELQE